MSAIRTGRPARVAALLVIGLGSSLVPSAAALAPAALVPPPLQALEQKMAQLQINSERFSEVSRGVISLTDESNGKPVGRTRHISADSEELGEASVSPAEGATFIGGAHRPDLIAIGSTEYEHQARKGRHWVRSSSHGESPAARILPFHGGRRLEVSAGGTGSFAGLLNLLTTAVGPVTIGGAVTVRGQSTTEFTATVEPRLLVKGITVEDVANFEVDEPIDTLYMFLTESGLPIRVVSAVRSRELDVTTTAEVLGVEMPVIVKAPPARDTVGIRHLQHSG
jgi:hypothetical protein